jgi:hypothetical protein
MHAAPPLLNSPPPPQHHQLNQPLCSGAHHLQQRPSTARGCEGPGSPYPAADTYYMHGPVPVLCCAVLLLQQQLPKGAAALVQPCGNCLLRYRQNCSGRP